MITELDAAFTLLNFRPFSLRNFSKATVLEYESLTGPAEREMLSRKTLVAEWIIAKFIHKWV